tara:strand:- start:247 stop:705 length:459 start_codon:yes stop_codon:yes gene_type:complete
METATQYIKVMLPGESVWADQFDEENMTARICNVPLCDGVGLHDIVRVREVDPDQWPEFVEVIGKTYDTLFLQYPVEDPDAEETSRTDLCTFNFIKGFLAAHDMSAEGMVIGRLAVAYPVKMSDDEITAVLDKLAEIYDIEYQLTDEVEDGD